MAILTNDTDLGREVALREIDRELRRLWEADTARSKASLMNLVIYSERPGSLAANSAMTRELTREQACRAILVEIDRSEPAITTRAWITAHCHLAAGRKAVCSEQIAFRLTGRSTGRLRNIVFSHLVSDLPLVLWWQGELSPLFMESLYSVVDRLIVDSADWQDPAASYARIEEAVSATSGHLIVQDLEWTRSYALRLAVASLFDGPAAAGRLTSMRDLRIVHHPAHRSAALQLLAWFATQAGWQRPAGPAKSPAHGGGEGSSFTFTQPAGDTISARLVPGPAQLPLSLIELTGDGVRLTVSAHVGAPHLASSCATATGTIETLLPAGPVDAAGLVADQLSRSGKNSLLRKIIPLFRELLGNPTLV